MKYTPSDYLFNEMLHGYEENIIKYTVEANRHKENKDILSELNMIKAANEVNTQFAIIEGYILGLKSAIIALAIELKVEE